MIFLMLFPFMLQSLIILFDEFYFHYKRGLPQWERIGHPLDTLTVLICYIFVLLFPFNALNMKIYALIALFSCLFVTKDEFIHKDCCPAAEQWLHALLFVNHSITLILLGMLWFLGKAEQPSSFLSSFQGYQNIIKIFFWVQTLFIASFAIYQVVYWNVLQKKRV